MIDSFCETNNQVATIQSEAAVLNTILNKFHSNIQLSVPLTPA